MTTPPYPITAVPAHEWDEEMCVSAVDLMLDLRDEDEFDAPTFEFTLQELQEMERGRHVEEIPWREAFCDFGSPFKCATWDHLRRTGVPGAS